MSSGSVDESIEDKNSFWAQVGGSDQDRWYREVEEIYQDMRAAAARGSYIVNCAGISIIVYPQVYSPCFFTDSIWFADALSEFVGNSSLLEIGTGTGLVAIACANRGAKVTATDINPAAVRNAKTNFHRHGVGINLHEGDLYKALPAKVGFDIIFWLHPFNKWDRPVNDQLLVSGFDHNYAGLRGYIAGAKEHLNPSGRLLLGTGSGADQAAIKEVAAECGYQLKVVRAEEIPLAYSSALVTGYFLCELLPV